MTAAVQILVGGVDATADVMFSTAKFTQRVNGAAGEGYMRVRDDASTWTFATGSDWLVLVNGDAAWRGFVTAVAYTYLAPTEDVAVTGLERVIDLHGGDLNLLFTRRFGFNAASPVSPGVTYPVNTADTTAISDLVTDWLDLSADSIDTTSGVTHVGNLDPAQKPFLQHAGVTWGQSMSDIAQLPAAIFYLRPESGTPRATLVYCDVDAPTAPFGLSDTPNGTTTKGYREMEIMLDGTSLANDVLEWGAGYGSQTRVFKRLTDAASVAAHGVWQQGGLRTGIYKQASIDRIADSIVNGSPEHKRGAKDDRPAVALTTWEPGLLAGHVVAFTSNVWGYSDAIPVRQMEITFEAPDWPRYDLLLSHEIDTPWNFFDVWPGFHGPGYCPNPPCIPPPPPGRCLDGSLPPCPGGCDCGITDSFNRTVASGWGTADDGQIWADSGLSATVVASVDGTSGLIVVQAFGGVCDLTLAVPPLTTPYDVVWGGVYWALGSLPSGGSGRKNKAFFEQPLSGFRLQVDGTGAKLLQVESSGGLVTVAFDFTLAPFNVRAHVEPGVQTQYRFWYTGTTEPVTWDATIAATTFNGDVVYVEASSNMNSSLTVSLDSLDITGVTRCTAVQFDDFNRVVSGDYTSSGGMLVGSGWGDATPSGDPWSIVTARAGQDDVGVDGASGWLSVGPAFLGANVVMSAAPVGIQQAAWTMTARVQGLASADYAFTAHDGAGNVDTTVAVAKMSSGGGYGTTGQAVAVGYLSGGVFVYASAPVAFTPGTWYTLKWQVTAGSVNQAKAWADGTAEPAWQASASPGPFAAAATNSLQPAAVAYGAPTDPPIVAHLDSIDFDYAGRPCYLTPACPFDDFNRTVPSGWGTATPGGVAWTLDGSLLNCTISVDGAHGLMSPTGTVSAAASLYAAFPYHAAAPNTQVISLRWPSSSVALPAVSGYLWDSPSFNDWVGFGINRVVAGGGHAAHLTIDCTSGFFSTTVADITPGALAYLKAEWDPVALTAKVKYWESGAVEPGWLFTQSIADPTIGSTPIYEVNMGVNAMGSACGPIEIDEIDACVQSPVSPTPGGTVTTAPNGWGCEVPTRVSSTVYSTASAFTANSVLAWRQGLLQRPGTDFTEDAGLHSITFSTSVGSTEEVRVCYFAGVLA